MTPKDCLTPKLKKLKAEMKDMKLSPPLMSILKGLIEDIKASKQLSKQNLKVSSRVEQKVDLLMTEPSNQCSGNLYQLTKYTETDFRSSVPLLQSSSSICTLPLGSFQNYAVVMNGIETTASFTTSYTDDGLYKLSSFKPKNDNYLIISSLIINFYSNNFVFFMNS
jgi:hypothetical protein